ncbi:heme-binding protein [Mycolicibacterium rhodesiae]|uniref:Hemophore-related protein n=1 Tax=Mycolicibacterium rhodesiae TaxID=36814 RepID=A0A1X0J036_MYCRH|nr:heme-binding protein [Mycolicibacterium rhodesiae]MCV7345357.1 heme-binding protein [Mycolicibacterium rhodesiae]ORB54971.1 hemophore-related protein [Mycolicibacterium rhodesiae]
MLVRNLISAGIISGAMLIGSAATAAADVPNCTAGDLTQVLSGVNAGMSVYLFTHPDVNAFFTGLKGKSRDEMRTAVADYLQANPEVRDQIKAVRQPAADFRARCDAPMPDDMGPMG